MEITLTDDQLIEGLTENGHRELAKELAAKVAEKEAGTDGKTPAEMSVEDHVSKKYPRQ